MKSIVYLFLPAQVSLELGLSVDVDDFVRLEKARHPQRRNKAEKRYFSQICHYMAWGLEIVCPKT